MEQYPKNIFSPNDSFTIRFSNSPNYPARFEIGKRDTIDYGSDGVVGGYATVRFGNDSLRLDYKNMPYRQVHFIPFTSQKGRSVLRFHFNEVMAAFPIGYINENRGKVRVAIPEVFELANVLWTLSPTGQRANNVNKEGSYYQAVMAYFKPWLNHPVFSRLSFPDSVAAKNYYDFRDNSLAFNFGKDQLVYNGPYYYVRGNDKNFHSLFKELLPLINDFARKAEFRSFYKKNKAYYEELVERQRELMPVHQMWVWLEEQFPNKYDAYKIVFSPLVSVSHSTQNFGSFMGKYFGETVMFVSGPNFYDSTKNASKALRQGIASGIVFTEIDHNYVNPVSNQYGKLIDSVFSNRELWTNMGGDTKFYESPRSVFNEYMTHAVFCLYALDVYDVVTAQAVISRREDLMVNRRRYIKFKEFNKALIELKKANQNTKVANLYPAILNWCQQQL